jgi:hypothetical protein
VLVAGEGEYVEDVAPAIGLVQPTPVYHWYEYGVVPPEGLAVRVIDWPESIVGEVGVMAPADSTEFTVRESPDEHALVGEYAESVTR